MKLNSCIAALPSGYLFAEIAKRVKAYSALHPDADLIRLGIGDVTRPLSKHVAQAMADAALGMSTPEGFHGYAPDYGYSFLIDAIIQGDYSSRGIEINPDEVFISDGAKPDVGNLQELFSADSRIAVTDPVYPVYVDSNAMSGRLGVFENGKWSRLIYLPCNAENDFVPSLPTEKADILYLCYPNNPTGTVLTFAQLKKFVDWAIEMDSIIVYDAAYKAFITRGDVPFSIYEIPGARKCAIECCSFSKNAGFTGVRCGYMIIPREVSGLCGTERVSLNRLWQRRASTKSNGVSYPVQVAAAAVYDEQGQREIMESVRYYLANAGIIRKGLAGAGGTVFGGTDSPYIWMQTPHRMKSWDFFDLLLNEANVVGTPGEGFGPSGEGYFRLTAFNTKEKTEEAVRRIAGVLAKL